MPVIAMIVIFLPELSRLNTTQQNTTTHNCTSAQPLKLNLMLLVPPAYSSSQVSSHSLMQNHPADSLPNQKGTATVAISTQSLATSHNSIPWPVNDTTQNRTIMTSAQPLAPHLVLLVPLASPSLRVSSHSLMQNPLVDQLPHQTDTTRALPTAPQATAE